MGVFVPLKNVSEENIDTLGQKAILLSQKSVEVPFSLVITTEAFEAFVKHNDLESDLKILFNNMELDSKALIKAFNQISEKIMNGSFPQEVSRSLRECFELSCLDTKSLDILQGKEPEHTILSLRRSTTYNDQDIQCSGIIFSKDDFHEFLTAIKGVYLSVFSPTSVVLRQKNQIENVSAAIIVTRLPRMTTCFESSYLVEQKKLFVSSYVGFLDKTKSIKRDFFNVGAEFLKINDQNITRQNKVSLFDIENNKPVIKPYTENTSSQSATEQTILEVARLTKKVAAEFDVPSVMADFVKDKEDKIYCLDLWTSKEVSKVPVTVEEPVHLVEGPSQDLRESVITFLKNHRHTKYKDAIDIFLRSLETDSSPHTLQQGLTLCQSILEQ